jgi:hypothetical protein
MARSVEFLWWEGCPSSDDALADLRSAMAEAGLDPASIEVTEVTSDADADQREFVGSPTIRVDGRDIQPTDEPAGLSCRIYRLRDGRVSPKPDPQDLIEALR